MGMHEHARHFAVVPILALVVTATSCTRTPSPVTAGDGPAYPATRTVDVVDDYHGTKVADPYRWLENTESPEVRAWAAAQRALVRRQLDGGDLRARLLSRMRTLGAPWDDVMVDAPTRVRGTEFRVGAAPGGTHAVLTVSRGGGSPARVLVDLATFGPDVQIARFHVSPDASHVAYELSKAGSEWVETRIRRIADGTDLPEAVGGVLFDAPIWTEDSRGFFYVHNVRPAPDERVSLKASSVRYHVVGTPQDQDRVLLQMPGDDITTVLEIALADGRYLVVTEGTGAHWEGMGWIFSRLHVADLRDPVRPEVSAALRPLTAARDAAHGVVGASGHSLYVLTDRGAPRHRLVAIDVRDPDPSRWRDVIPESARVLQRVQRVGRRLLAVYLEDVQAAAQVFDDDGRLRHTLHVPPLTHLWLLDPLESGSEVDVMMESFLTPPRVTRIDVETGTSRVVSRPPAPLDLSGLEARQEWYSAADGTRIPLFVVHRKGLVRDGTHPTIIYAYGASGTVTPPRYAEDVLAWVELGGIYAVASLRGGGEFGRAWLEAAMLERKQTTFDDLVAAAEYLVAEKYSSTAHLAIRGSSNGGLLVSAVLTQRPDLFAAALPDVPITDNLRFNRGRHEGQFGSPKNPAQFRFLFAASPLHRVRPGTCYPAALITAALNDDRAPAWHALKFAAALQAAQSCARPILLRADEAGGHMGSRGPDAFLEDTADVLVFAATHLGLTPLGRN
jgi:prolyl oligopeptidase